MPFSALSQHQISLAKIGQRQLLVLAGDKAWQLCQIEQLKLVCQGDWLTLSSADEKVITPAQSTQLLGREFLHAIFDANESFNAEALAILTGTLKAGSWLVLCLPHVEDWDHYIDNDSQRWSDDEGALFTPHFMSWLKAKTLNNPQVIVWQQTKSLSLPEITSPTAHWNLPQGQPTTEQQHILTTLLAAQSGVYSVIAARGRGKSALAGMLIEQYSGSVVVCAPAKKSIEVLSAHTQKIFSFYSPDNLLALCLAKEETSDWLIIDEAAMLPIAQLIALCRYFPRVLMTTTVQGYEGTGRGFMLKLGDSIENLHTYQLQTPIRWSKDDRLEHWLNELLLLDEPNYDLAKQQGNIEVYPHSMTPCLSTELNHLAQIADFYPLLTSAHYRTTPLDLRRLLDGKKQHYWSAFVNNSRVGAVWCIEEGGLSEALAQGVWLGIRRPRGNLVAQSLVTYGLTVDAMRLTSLRISRIAVLPPYRRQKVAATLIANIVKQSQQKGRDYLSVSFGYTTALAAFWVQCGFKIVRLGTHKEASSGCYTAMAIYPLTEQGQQLQDSALKVFTQQYPQIAYQTGITLPKYSLSTIPFTQQEHGLMMAGFAFAHRSVLTVYSSVAKYLNQTTTHYPLLNAFFIEQQSMEYCVSNFKLAGKKALIKMLRQQCAQLMAEIDPQLTQHFQQWLTTSSHLSYCHFLANHPHHPIYH